MFACSHISIFPSLWLKVHFVSSVSLSSLAGCIPPSCLWFYHLFFGLSLKIQFFFHMKRNIWCLSWGAESRLWLVVCMQMFHVLSWQIVSWTWPWFHCQSLVLVHLTSFCPSLTKYGKHAHFPETCIMLSSVGHVRDNTSCLMLYLIVFNVCWCCLMGCSFQNFRRGNLIFLKQQLETFAQHFNKMLPVHLCVRVCMSMCGLVCMCSPHLSRGSTQQSLSTKSAECEGWCQMTNLRDKLHLKQTFFIVCPSPLQLSPSILLSIYFSPLHLSNPLISP